ncbi:hypothetical protein B0T18DRAFT_132582 [Schizothecium vesticola]|uniref:Uncharacterized protein n=1 Tax=Schizothecium vesticola TaxID=314040 RepID=A0AA40K4D6_9PEZI|nr:hypothetical protein B0T18DRAFT_132582 [Schizothecium vesticola]
MQIENVMSRAGALLARIAIFASFSLESDSNVFNDTLEAWLTDPSFQLRNGSTVGLCCSSVLSLQFPEQPLCDDGLTTEFRRFLLAKSLAHSGWLGGKVGVSHAAPRGAGHVSGYRLLKRLDRTLTSQFLAQFDRESCQILFLMVLGTVLSVGGGSPPPASEESPACPPEIFNPTFQKSPTLWLAMKEHLSQMLAHHLIFLGSMLGIRLETGFEQRIIDTAVHQWNNAGIFVWGNAAGLSRHGHSLPYGMPLRLQGESHRSFGQPLPTAGPCIEPLTPIPCPELAHFQPSAVERWSDNPQSYLEMTDEPEDFSSPSEYATSPVLVGKIEAPRSNSDPFPSRGSTQPKTHEVQRRTIWVVRSFDGGSEHGNVKVHARLRGNRNVNDFAAFV